MQAKKAFSFVEIIIVVSIIALLTVVWISYQWAQNQNTKNTKAIWDLGTLNNSLLSYMEVEKTLPLPKWNKNYFTKVAEYSHSATWAYWVHGFVTQDLLPNKYLNYLPLDPRTNQYYAYWKTLDNNFYEVAWVLKENWEYISKVQWNYPADNWPYSLIREYNWADFVSDNSKISFPYNPEERILVWKINNYTGTVKITWENNSYIISDSNWLLSHTLIEWDTIETWDTSSTTIFFSDWSQSVLEENSKLVLKELKFKEKDNLLTRVNLFLESGTLWTKATSLNSENWTSDFEVYTDDTTAAVRWTIFSIKDNWSTTSVTVVKWKVKVFKNTNPTTNIIVKEWEETSNATSTGSSSEKNPEFTVITKLPNNTITWAVIEDSDLVAEYIEKSEKNITLSWTWIINTKNVNEIKVDINSIKTTWTIFAWILKIYCSPFSCNLQNNILTNILTWNNLKELKNKIWAITYKNETITVNDKSWEIIYSTWITDENITLWQNEEEEWIITWIKFNIKSKWVNIGEIIQDNNIVNNRVTIWIR